MYVRTRVGDGGENQKERSEGESRVESRQRKFGICSPARRRSGVIFPTPGLGRTAALGVSRLVSHLTQQIRRDGREYIPKGGVKNSKEETSLMAHSFID